MGDKRTRFKARANTYGQTGIHFPFSAWATGSYVDSWSGEPDPGSVNYPTGTQPGPTWGQTGLVSGFFQPGGTWNKEKKVRAPWGEEVNVNAVLWVPGDMVIGLWDKFVINGTTYYIAALAPWYDGGEIVHIAMALTKSVPRKA